MSKVIRLSESLAMQAREVGEVSGRSSSQQIEYWVRLGKFAEDHSDLTGQMCSIPLDSYI
ncbi:hypothetical protein [Polynucleobacter sp.]|jgi:hypothetical protein|uniref:TA system antitoxin ParD family protein n=1 Tax=Polynucleobacter sp. TaxID=2029855 RepID=UPI0037C63835